MVWRFEIDDFNLVYLGLYHSIARNSIPIFVEKSYYKKIVEEFFNVEGKHYVIEAKIVGMFKEIPENFIRKFIEANQLAGKIMPTILSYTRMAALRILVDGKDAGIQYIGKSRYLDGDI